MVYTNNAYMRITLITSSSICFEIGILLNLIAHPCLNFTQSKGKTSLFADVYAWF